MDVENLYVFPQLPPEVYFFLVGSVRRLYLTDMLKDLLVVSVIVE